MADVAQPGIAILVKSFSVNTKQFQEAYYSRNKLSRFVSQWLVQQRHGGPIERDRLSCLANRSMIRSSLKSAIVSRLIVDLAGFVSREGAAFAWPGDAQLRPRAIALVDALPIDHVSCNYVRKPSLEVTDAAPTIVALGTLVV